MDFSTGALEKQINIPFLRYKIKQFLNDNYNLCLTT